MISSGFATVLLLSSLVALGVAICSGWTAGVRRMPGRAGRALSLASWILDLCASLALVLVAVSTLSAARAAEAAGGAGGAPVAVSGLRVDRLSALFLLIAFGVAVPGLLSGMTRGLQERARLGAGVAAVLLGVVLVMAASDLFTLMFGWEGLGMAFYAVVGHDWARRGRPRAAVLAAGFSSFSGLCILLAGAILAGRSHSLELAVISSGATPATRAAAYLLFIVGFAVKVGLVPLHVWLPDSYSAAPGPARAILAGCAVNVGFYGLWRALQILGAPPVWLACAVLVVGGASAVLGISHATVHADLAHLISWSSVENAGVILVGYGVGLVGTIEHRPGMVAAGLVAATAQVIAHALGKSLLFVSAAAVEDAYGTTDLDRLRGVARRLPFSGLGLVIGALTMAGVPMTAGFASEWLTLEALMQQFRIHTLALNLALALAGVLVALSVGVAGVAFVRLIALTAFGGQPARLAAGRNRYERGAGHRAGVAVLCLGCLGVAALAPVEMRTIAAGLGGLAPGAGSVVTGRWILQPGYADFSALSPSWLWIVIPAYVVIVVLGVWALSGGRLTAVRRVEPWASGSPGVARGRGYTSFGYANPVRKVLAALLLTRGELSVLDPSGGAGEARDGAASARLGYTVDVMDVVGRFLYRPLVPVGRFLTRCARGFQSGRLDMYLSYMLVALLAVLAVTVLTFS